MGTRKRRADVFAFFSCALYKIMKTDCGSKARSFFFFNLLGIVPMVVKNQFIYEHVTYV